MKKKQKKKPKRLERISLYPLKPEEALSAFMEIEPSGKGKNRKKDALPSA